MNSFYHHNERGDYQILYISLFLKNIIKLLLQCCHLISMIKLIIPRINNKAFLFQSFKFQILELTVTTIQ